MEEILIEGDFDLVLDNEKYKKWDLSQINKNSLKSLWDMT